MSNSSLVTYTKISPNKNSPRNNKIDTISIHCVVGQLTAQQVLNLPSFTKYDYDNGCSCNYAVGTDGSIGLCVEEKDRSWCTSNSANDNRAITIEVASDTTHPYKVNDTAYKALINLLVDVCKRNGIKQLLWKGDKNLIGNAAKQNMTVHRWFANKACPGDYLYNKHGEIAAEVNARLGAAEPTPEPKPVTPAPTTSAIKEGDVVSITPGATYYDDTDVPNWVEQKKWIVMEVSGDRAVIDKSADGRNYICSPINVKYLTPVNAEVKPEVKPEPEPAPAKKSIDELAQEVIKGKWGNGDARKTALTKAGYDYNAVQNRVNEILEGESTPAKSIDELAREVIRGDWGNGDERKNALIAAGYDYYAVQNRVNEILEG